MNLQRSFHTFSACSFRRPLAAKRAALLPKGGPLDHDYFLARGHGRMRMKDHVVPARSFGRNALEMGENSSPLSSSPRRSAPPGRANEPATALRRARPTQSVGSYSRDTPGLRHFKHTADPAEHRTPLRPPQPFPG